MFDHEYYAHAFVWSSNEDQIKYYLEFKDAVKLFRDNPKFVDTLLFNRALFKDFKEDFEEGYSSLVYNFLDIVVEDGMIDQIFKIENSIRDILVSDGKYNYCVIESAEALKDDFAQKLSQLIHKQSDGNVEIVEKINPRLKSGVRIFLNDKTYDLSMVGRLERLYSEVS